MNDVDDWGQFVTAVPWFVRESDDVQVGDPGAWERAPIKSLPRMSELLAQATVTPVAISGSDHELLAWGPSARRRGWLCLAPQGSKSRSVAPIHQQLWAACGGIVERFGEPESWLLNQDEVLTPSAASISVAGVLEDYRWLWADGGLELPIKPEDFYAVAVEANGNLTIAHKRDGTLLLFAPDHAFSDVTPLEGCPPYSLMTFASMPDLTAWIERCAKQWS